MTLLSEIVWTALAVLGLWFTYAIVYQAGKHAGRKETRKHPTVAEYQKEQVN